MKKLSKIIFIIIIMLLLTGCTTEYNRDDVADFIHKKTGLKHFKVSKGYQEATDEENYPDRLWKVYDNEKGFIFYVMDDYGWGMESPSNYLRTDYYSKLFFHEKDKIKNVQNIKYTNETEYDVYDNIEFQCEYRNKSELKECYTSLEKMSNIFDRKLKLLYRVEYSFNGRNMTSKPKDEADVMNRPLETIDNDSYQYNLYLYYAFGLGYHRENILQEMTKQDLEDVLTNEETYRVYKINDQEEIIKTYDNAVGVHAGSVSYSGLYTILKEENYNVIGDHHHFKVVNETDTYEFSDNYLDYLYDNNEKGYYYLKNGERIKNRRFWDDCYDTKEINEMFGLKIKTIKNKYNK